MMQERDEHVGYLNPVHDMAARAIADVLSQSGVLPSGPALNCAMACLTKMAMNGLAVTEGEMELWIGPREEM
jgi:hypothetical protein